jgi:hypothetical protein
VRALVSAVAPLAIGLSALHGCGDGGAAEGGESNGAGAGGASACAGPVPVGPRAAQVPLPVGLFSDGAAAWIVGGTVGDGRLSLQRGPAGPVVGSVMAPEMSALSGAPLAAGGVVACWTWNYDDTNCAAFSEELALPSRGMNARLP